MARSSDAGVRTAFAQALRDDPLWGSDSPGDPEGETRARTWRRLCLMRRRVVRHLTDDVLAMLGMAGIAVVPVTQGGVPLELGLSELEILAEEEHKRWMRTRARGGWRRGPVRDHARRTHPSMVPYSELPQSERDKDRERILRLPGILAGAGLGVLR